MLQQVKRFDYNPLTHYYAARLEEPMRTIKLSDAISLIIDSQTETVTLVGKTFFDAEEGPLIDEVQIRMHNDTFLKLKGV